MTPYEINLLLHCHTCQAPHLTAGNELFEKTISSFVKFGLVENTGNEVYRTFYKTTTKGAAHVNQLCQLALPTQLCKWIGDGGKEILM